MGWKITISNAEVFGVHAALLPSGHIIYFTGNEYDLQEQATGQFAHTRLYDCATDRVLFVSSPSKEDDVFCCGHAMLSSGRLLIAGGSEHLIQENGKVTTEPGAHRDRDHVPGIRKAWIFDPFRQQWFPAADMADGPLADANDENPHPKKSETGGRWYPTLVTLPDKKVMAFGGHPGSGDKRHHNNVPELYEESSRVWSIHAPFNADTNIKADAAYYPRLHILPSGNIFCSSILKDDNQNDDWWEYEIGRESTPGAWVRTNTLVNGAASSGLEQLYSIPNFNYQSSAVLLPFLPEHDYEAKILLCGGRTAWVMTPGRPVTVSQTGPRGIHKERRQCNTVLLPTGQVFVCGGVNGNAQAVSQEIPDTEGVLEAELYTPETNSWETLERASVVRNYHSVALLMPDGRVWTAGSSIDGKHPGVGVHPPGWRREIEVYTPWYCDRSDRPEITEILHDALSSDTLLINTPQDDIERVVIIRTGAVTHCFNSDQRYIRLKFKREGNGALLAEIPSSAIAIPGYYLLFLINRAGVPSKGKFIFVTHQRFREPREGFLFTLLGGLYGFLPGGQIKPIPPDDPYQRDMLTGLVIYEMAKNIDDDVERGLVQRASLNLVSNTAQKVMKRI